MKHESYPPLYIAADRLAVKFQERFLRILVLQGVLLLLIAGAGFLTPDRKISLVVTFLFVSFISLSAYLMVGRPDQGWYGARAVAESVKTMTWRFMCCAPPFNGELPEARVLFVQRLLDVLNSNSFVAKRLDAPQVADSLTAAMLRHRTLALAAKVSYYRQFRIEDQRGWYSRTSRTARIEGLVAYWLLVIFCVIGLIIGLLSPYFGHGAGGIAALGFVTTGCAFMMTWVQAKRYWEISAAYSVSAHEIAIVAARLQEDIDQRAFEEFVAEAENAFSREHTQWAARRDN